MLKQSFGLLTILLFPFLFSCSEDEPGKADEAPVIANQGFIVEENSPAGTAVGTVLANDPDTGDDLTFSITSGNTDNAFAINASSGALTVSNPDALDFEETPSFDLTIEVTDGTETASATVTIALTDIFNDPYANRDQILLGLAGCYADIKSYIEYTYLFDAIYADIQGAPSAGWDDVDDHTVTADDAKVTKLWEDAWSIAYRANNVISSSEGILTGSEKTQVIAQGKLLRAYLFYNLMIWFGPIPLDEGLRMIDEPRSSMDDVLEFLQDDLTSAIDGLPQIGSVSGFFPKSAAKALLARVYLQSEDWAEASALGESFIAFTLSEDPEYFTEGNEEIIWGFAQTGDEEFSDFYIKGNFVPALRLTDIYLIKAEADLNLGQTSTAIDSLNILRDRWELLTPIPVSAAPDLVRDYLLEHWEIEMIKEGTMFEVYRRFGIAQSALAIDPYQELLPIPASALAINFSLTQNVGYP